MCRPNNEIYFSLWLQCDKMLTGSRDYEYHSKVLHTISTRICAIHFNKYMSIACSSWQRHCPQGGEPRFKIWFAPALLKFPRKHFESQPAPWTMLYWWPFTCPVVRKAATKMKTPSGWHKGGLGLLQQCQFDQSGMVWSIFHMAAFCWSFPVQFNVYIWHPWKWWNIKMTSKQSLRKMNAYLKK